MQLFTFPDDVAIGGLEAQADRLADEAALATEQAEALILSILRGDRRWREEAPRREKPRQVA